MPAQLTHPKNLASTVIHYGATLGLAAASFALGGPIGIGIAAALTGGISYFVIREQKRFMENNLVRHPDVHKYSPNLGKMATELYKKTGLSAADYPLYDFRADHAKTKDRGLMGEIMEDAFKTMGQTHNAAALNFGKPVIMISEPLLKLLDDNEEKAVLAHEFAHAAGNHTRLGLPQKLLGGLAVATNSMTMIGAWWATGFKGIFASIAASIGARIGTTAILSVFDRDKVLNTREAFLDDAELIKRKQLKSVIKGVATVASTAVLTYFNPIYLGLWAATKAIGLANKVVTGAYSRSLEYQADQGAVELGADPLALAVGLRKIEAVVEQSKKEAFGDNLPKKGELSKMWNKVTASHPTTENRIARLAKMAEKQGVSATVINQAVHGKIEVSNDHNIPYHVLKDLAHGM